MLVVRTAILSLIWLLAGLGCVADRSQTQTQVERHPFSCQGRPSGYYADIASDCQMYHQCDGGRLFTHSCPDMTRFQQRMMVCDHWYSVDCSTAEEDYAANLLLGQRDRLFVEQGPPPRRAAGRRRVPHHRVSVPPAPRAPLQEPSTPVEGPVPRITFRYLEATSPRNGARQLEATEESRDDSSASHGHGEGDLVPATTLAPADSGVFLDAGPRSRDYVEVHLSDPRLMFFIPDSGQQERLDSAGNSTVVILLDHQHAAMRFRSEGRALPRGRDPRCPDCLPAFLAPGRCQPCVTIR